MTKYQPKKITKAPRTYQNTCFEAVVDINQQPGSAPDIGGYRKIGIIDREKHQKEDS
jgi:hypothetical protein